LSCRVQNLRFQAFYDDAGSDDEGICRSKRLAASAPDRHVEILRCLQHVAQFVEVNVCRLHNFEVPVEGLRIRRDRRVHSIEEVGDNRSRGQPERLVPFGPGQWQHFTGARHDVSLREGGQAQQLALLPTGDRLVVTALTTIPTTRVAPFALSGDDRAFTGLDALLLGERPGCQCSGDAKRRDQLSKYESSHDLGRIPHSSPSTSIYRGGTVSQPQRPSHGHFLGSKIHDGVRAQNPHVTK